MQSRRSPVGMVVQAPAKLNLLFEVLAKRDDGYHEVETLMCPISLYDTLYIREERSEQVALTCRWAVARQTANGGRFNALPEGRANLAVQAVELLRAEAGVSRGATIRLVKRIPLGAGLGGGSSDAAAALLAANAVWGLNWSIAELTALAARLGSDVPFFLAGTAAVCCGRGEQVAPAAQIGRLWFVVACPPDGLATPAVYAVCRPATQPIGTQPLLCALREGNLAAAGRLLSNRLQPAAEGLSPWIGRLKREFARHDFLGHTMSGSGTSYFGLCRHARHARRVAARLRAGGIGQVVVAHSCRCLWNQGESPATPESEGERPWKSPKSASS